MQRKTQQTLMKTMAWIGVGMAAVTIFLRAWLMPSLRDAETGLFSSGKPVVALMLLALVVLAAMGLSMPKTRWEIAKPDGVRVGAVTIFSGVVLVLCGLWDSWLWFVRRQMPAPEAASVTTLTVAALLLQVLFGIVGGVALVRLGLLTVSEGGTRRGIAGWSMLAPVLWMWFRLARYEMSYVSTVRFSESFFNFVMFILELLFLFKLARYTAGVGRVGAGRLEFYAAATAMFALSSPLTRVAMYLLGDSEAYLANELAGVADVAIGILAAAVAFGLSARSAEEEAPEGKAPEGKAPEATQSAEESSETTSPVPEDDSFDFIIGE